MLRFNIRANSTMFIHVVRPALLSDYCAFSAAAPSGAALFVKASRICGDSRGLLSIDRFSIALGAGAGGLTVSLWLEQPTSDELKATIASALSVVIRFVMFIGAPNALAAAVATARDFVN